MKAEAGMMRRVVREIERYGRTDLMAYLQAHKWACDVLGAKIDGPLGLCSRRRYTERLIGIALAAEILDNA